MITKLQKLLCKSCTTEYWVEVEDGNDCNCPKCGATKYEVVDEWEPKQDVILNYSAPTGVPVESSCSTTSWCTTDFATVGLDGWDRRRTGPGQWRR